MMTINEEMYDSLMSQGKRAEADAYAEEHGEFEFDPLLDLDDEAEEEMDSPRECVACASVFDAAVYFVRHPYRVYCPDCGETQPKEYDYDYYIEY